MTSVLVLGGGPAGYVAAGRAAQLGAQVTLVEDRELGGTCLNRGCIPTKAMVVGATRLHEARNGVDFGVECGPVGLNYAAFTARREAVTAELRSGVAHLLKSRKVQVIAARGRLADPNHLLLHDGEELRGDAVILASGSEPVLPDLFDFSDPRVMSSDQLLLMDHLPETLAIIGGGVIGCEFASVFSRLGTKVTVIEMLDQLLPGEDQRVGRALQQAFKRVGIEVMLKTAVEESLAGDDDLILRLSDGDQLVAARALVAVGRRPLSHGLGYEEAGVELDSRGFVVTDDSCRTSLAHVFAAGDLAGPPLLAHWAYHQGAIAAENAVTGSRLVCHRSVVPNCVFTSPEVASCGLTEDRAKAAAVEYEVVQARFGGNAKAVVEGESEGFVRLTCEPGGGRLLGASLIGAHACELVHELALAVQTGRTLLDVAATIHAHPTLSEAIGEAALGGFGRGLHSM